MRERGRGGAGEREKERERERKETQKHDETHKRPCEDTKVTMRGYKRDHERSDRHTEIQIIHNHWSKNYQIL